MKRRHARLDYAFTIVELLVVIVVIGVLAAISLISYGGIQNRAALASVDSDLTSATTSLKLFNAEYGSYPLTTDCGQANSSTNLCLKNTSGNSLSYSPASGSNPKYYTLSAANASRGVRKVLSSDSDSITGAPLNPVGDWLAVPQGEHYGGYYDLITGQFATITRASVKTIYDAKTQKIYDVPANYLGVRPRSDGGGGYEAEIENTRTNMLTQSSFENTMAGWFYQFAGYGVATPSDEKSVYGNYSLKVTRTVSGSEANVWQNLSGLAASSVYSYSAWTWANTAGTACLFTYNASVNMGSSCNSGSSKWERVSGVFTSSAAGTAQLRLSSSGAALTSVYFDAVQVELGSYPTSYIPTTTTAVTRPKDYVVIPAISSFSAGTVFSVMANTPSGASNNGVYTFGYNVGNQVILYSPQPTNIQAAFGKSGSFTYSTGAHSTSTYNTASWKWGSFGTQQTLNGVIGTVSSVDIPAGTVTAGYIGSYFGDDNNRYDSSIQRVTMYDSVVSDSDVTTISNAISSGE